MEQRSCGMRIAVTEREAICFNAKREIGGACTPRYLTFFDSHGNEHEAVKLRNANCREGCGRAKHGAARFNAKRVMSTEIKL